MKKLLLILILSTTALAKVKITKLDYKNDNNFGVVTINLDAELKETPELTIKDDMVQLAIPNSYVWPKIENQVSVNNKFDSTLMAYQFDKDLVRVRANLPYDLKGKENKVSVVLGDKSISLYFPKLAVKTNGQKVASAIKHVETETTTKTKKTDSYDESYLNTLLKDKEAKAAKTAKTITNYENVLNSEKTKVQTEVVDQVKTKASALAKNEFNFSSYIFKFIGFFALLVAGLYAAFNFFRKGMLKKSGLGFFSSAKMVEVLSTTYLGPKRSILVIRAHKQVFLVAQSEKGMDFLTEIKDTAAFIKDGEKEVIGSNFDTNLEKASSIEKDFKLKEMIQATEKQVEVRPEYNAAAEVTRTQKDKVSLSKQIKSKVKELKQFQ
ncbi:flagellar biosynthetic protein FliO [Bacteriovorax sp. Seq25_V]|uniref:flagellar biosynthetic protein FliO n=1 Tax=Bacteriovorax sp. Seq25_V TaxID=1201288 RepID=UPI000389EB15|nr:flagellar biosynthetic protein FliO [Bacteriovorax sp. Seq25_V]EQC47282.1 flagellar biosynthesis protein FliO [Bacteriovorax sp. Seq25_V]